MGLLVQIFGGNSKGKGKAKSSKKTTKPKKTEKAKKNNKPKQITTNYSDTERASYHMGVAARLSGITVSDKHLKSLPLSERQSYENGLNGVTTKKKG